MVHYITADDLLDRSAGWWFKEFEENTRGKFNSERALQEFRKLSNHRSLEDIAAEDVAEYINTVIRSLGFKI